MAKSKAPSPQEIYRQRREREENEKNAYLPPGLINHGNTCFMNSVLQGLIATRLLVDLVHFQEVPAEIQVTAATPIVSRRSPQLTNGHNLAGSYERDWVNTMPIGDMFLTVMYKAWSSQAARTREIISPKPILGALGQKYDQYLDFAQQDAHEFLRILLDAMRMEEQDVIKVRQPPRPKQRRRVTITAKNAHDSVDGASTDLQLLSFADMIFGGQLTSILVCQTCKHVSQSYEEFNDISLSIKSDDYMHSRKRDRFKKIVGRLTQFPGGSNQNKEQSKNNGLLHSVELLRASSVPPSPRTERDAQLGHEAPPPSDTVRRRSLDIQVDPAEAEPPKIPNPPAIEVTESKSSADPGEGVTLESENSPILVNVISPEQRHIEFASEKKEKGASVLPSSPPRSKEKHHKPDDNSWTKIGRRISLSVGLGRPRIMDKEKDKKERERKSRSMDRRNLNIPGAIGESNSASEVTTPLDPPVIPTSRDTPTPSLDSLKYESAIDDSTSTTSSGKSAKTSVTSPLLVASPQPIRAVIPSMHLNHRKPSPQRPSQTGNLKPPIASTSSLSSAEIPRSKSPKPPKPNAAEAEYLRKILADVAVVPANPFASIFKPPIHHSHSSTNSRLNGVPSSTASIDSSYNQSAAPEKSTATSWLGMGMRQFTGIEECLRMFTAVEVLDGENKVGCRRCWKIQNGTLNTSKKDSDADEEEENGDDVGPPDNVIPNATLGDGPVTTSRPRLQPLHTARPAGINRIPASFSTPTVSYYTSISGGSSSRSVSSLPLETGSLSETSEDSLACITPNGKRTSRGPGGLPIPVISTTAPDTPTESSSSDVIAESLGGMDAATSSVPSPHPKLTQKLYGYSPTQGSQDSLVIPQRKVFTRKPSNMEPFRTDDESDDLSDVSSVSGDSVASRNSASVSTDPSSVSQSSVPQPTAPPKPPPKEKKPSKPKPVIMRPAYKRYLIATPPPVLVVHLKRFQQTSKSPLISFSHGFKKLDDYISFPEHLDLAPFLAPKKEDYGLGRKGKKKEKQDGPHPKNERCMYRLYAVVVHIGNMLGGHYIAYTALPSDSPVASSRGASSANSANAAPTPPSNSDKVETEQNRDHADSAPPPAKPKERQWAYISDTVVRLTTLEEVLHAKAYMCMYERC